MNDLTKVFINLNKCSAKEHIHIFSLLPSEPHRDAYNIFRGYTYLHFIPKSKYQEKEKWMVDRKVFDKTELTYPEFIKLFEGGEGETPDPTAQLKADKEELLEALEYANRMLKNSKDAMYDENYIESLIQKHKQ